MKKAQSQERLRGKRPTPGSPKKKRAAHLLLEDHGGKKFRKNSSVQGDRGPGGGRGKGDFWIYPSETHGLDPDVRETTAERAKERTTSPKGQRWGRSCYYLIRRHKALDSLHGRRLMLQRTKRGRRGKGHPDEKRTEGTDVFRAELRAWKKAIYAYLEKCCLANGHGRKGRGKKAK